MSIEQIASLIVAATTILSTLAGIIVGLMKIIEGQKCLLRSEMLRIRLTRTAPGPYAVNPTISGS